MLYPRIILGELKAFCWRHCHDRDSNGGRKTMSASVEC